jgi:hypothetical protein
MPHALPSFVALAVAASLASADVAAMGLGSVRSATLLGHPLNVAVPVRLEADESLEAECVRVEVLAGDAVVDRDSVRVRVTTTGDNGERLIRITTLGVINEPIVTLTLTAGCPPRISRKFVTFADPPEFRLAQAGPSQAASPPSPAAQPAPVPAPPADAAPVLSSVPPDTRAASAEPAPRSAASTQARPAPRRRAVRPEGAPPRRAVATAPSASRAAPAAPAAQSRLRLDVVEPLPATAIASAPPTSDPQAVAAHEAASAARAELAAAQVAASAADARMRALESELAKLRADAQANREAVTQLRARPPVAELGSSYLPWLVGLLALLVLLAIGLGWRLLQLSRPPVRTGTGTGDRWYGPSEVPESVHGEVKPPAPAPEVRPAVTSAAVASAPAPLGETRPQALAVKSHRHREVTVEEQIDLEQQADFFIALGQDDAAIDLLLTHLRGTGGTSPMPYLKLLDIYRRCGDHDAYDRTRARFNQRFNGVAPAWSDDPSAGRALEEYPGVLARVQRVWWTPLDAMAELESMLFRKGEGAELFDLPAYLEVLCLYQVARDLHQHEQDAGEATAAPVDVLLPIGGAASGDPMSVRHFEMDRTATLRGPAVARGELVSLDLDLSGEEDRVFPSIDEGDMKLRDVPAARPPASDKL